MFETHGLENFFRRYKIERMNSFEKEENVSLSHCFTEIKWNNLRFLIRSIKIIT